MTVLTGPRPRAFLPAVAAIATAGGTAAALHYARLGLTLSHYDARGHLIVARRVFDSITPGWQQFGAVWLPLPHLLNAIPVQLDLLYRTGASGVAISVVSFAIAATAIAAIVLRLTASVVAAGVAAAVFVLNPNVLYLQATPMTEPLLLALLTLGVALLIRDLPPSFARVQGVVLALACLTRYEAWPVTYLAIVLAGFAWLRQGRPVSATLRRFGTVALYPTLALILFAIVSRVVVGRWFVSGDFFVPENKALGAPSVAVDEIAWGVRQLSGAVVTWMAAAGAVAMLATGAVRRSDSASLVPLALAATALVPLAAFVDGHPFRIRYMVPLIAFEATAVGCGVGLLRRIPRARWDVVAAVIAAGVAAYEVRPLDSEAPMVVEAQWDRPNVAARAQVTACLAGRDRHDKIMASMGSLGHYMQEASRAGFELRDFLHEGNGDIWLAALDDPRPFAGWILIEEKAEGGDMLAKLAREHPAFLTGYSRVCEAAGLALYQRQNLILSVKR